MLLVASTILSYLLVGCHADAASSTVAVSVDTNAHVRAGVHASDEKVKPALVRRHPPHQSPSKTNQIDALRREGEAVDDSGDDSGDDSPTPTPSPTPSPTPTPTTVDDSGDGGGDGSGDGGGGDGSDSGDGSGDGGDDVVTQNCEMSEWHPADTDGDCCTVTCGGGKCDQKRVINVKPRGPLAVQCPDRVEREEACNMDPCPTVLTGHHHHAMAHANQTKVHHHNGHHQGHHTAVPHAPH